MDPRSIPDDIAEIGRSLLRFVAQEVEPLERANAELLASERTIYDASGRFVPEVLGLRAEVLAARRAQAAKVEGDAAARMLVGRSPQAATVALSLTHRYPHTGRLWSVVCGERGVTTVRRTVGWSGWSHRGAGYS